jgi:hypothetical protein
MARCMPVVHATSYAELQSGTQCDAGALLQLHVAAPGDDVLLASLVYDFSVVLCHRHTSDVTCASRCGQPR